MREAGGEEEIRGVQCGLQSVCCIRKARSGLKDKDSEAILPLSLPITY